MLRVKKNFEQVEGQFSARRRDLEVEIKKAYQHGEYLVELVRENAKKTVSELKDELQTINQQFYQIQLEPDSYLDDLSDNPLSYQIPETRKKFTPGSNPVVDIEKAYGCVSTDGDTAVGFQCSKDKPKPVHPTSASSERIKDKPKLVYPTSRIVNIPFINFTGAVQWINIKQMISQLQVTQCGALPPYHPGSIEKFRDGTLCYFCFGHNVLYFLDKCGDIKELKLDEIISDIAIHPTTEVLYSACINDYSLRTVDIHTGITSIIFMTQYNFSSIAFVGDGTILVGYFDKNTVVNYTMRGEVLKSVIVTQPMNMSVCDNTGNIVIASRKSGALVMNKDLQTVFVYKGKTKKKQNEEELFFCGDAVFDTKGHLLVGDYRNKEVHVVDAKTGKFLRTINYDKFGGILSLCVSHDGGLCVGTDTPNALFVTCPNHEILEFVKYL